MSDKVNNQSSPSNDNRSPLDIAADLSGTMAVELSIADIESLLGDTLSTASALSVMAVNGESGISQERTNLVNAAIKKADQEPDATKKNIDLQQVGALQSEWTGYATTAGSTVTATEGSISNTTSQMNSVTQPLSALSSVLSALSQMSN